MSDMNEKVTDTFNSQMFLDDETENKKHREPPIVFRNIDHSFELNELVKLLDGKITKEDECSVEELHQYLIEDEGSWTLGDNFLSFVKGVLQGRGLPGQVKVHLIKILACAALKDDVILLLHQDRRDHVLMNFSQEIEKHSAEVQEAWALFICNLFENISSSEWLLYISEWPYQNQNISNIRGTTKVAVHCLLATGDCLQDIGTSIIYNLSIMEIKTVVFDDLAVELTLAILQFFQEKRSEEHIFRTLKAVQRFVFISSDVGQFIEMIGPHPLIFKGLSKRVDEIIVEISKKISPP